MNVFTQAELDEILIKHKKWLSNEVGGKRADLRYANLRYADLSGADLSGADLSGANTDKVSGIVILSIDNIGTFNGKATFLPSENTVWAGCWQGTLDEFMEKGLEANRKNEKEMRNIQLAYEFFKNNAGEAK